MKNSNYSKFMLLWLGELVSSIGGGLTSFGLSVYVFQTTGSAANTAIVSLIAFLPCILLSAPAGVLADRYDRRLMMMLGDGCSAIGIIYILICMIRGNASVVEICIGVGISSIFSSLLEPAYRATVSDLLTKEEFSKANGMVGLAGNARYLVSPLLAGFLLGVADVKLLLIIDISTFVLTVASTFVVKKGIESKAPENTGSFMDSFKEGWEAISANKGVLILIIASSVITCFLGAIQILAEPMVLNFTNSTTLGIVETVVACGMMLTSIILGVRGLKKNFVNHFSNSLVVAGIGMIGFGLMDNLFVILPFGFLFFAMIPIANNCLDYLVRTNIPVELQGRAWGLIGLISQLGYVIAYGAFGFIADFIANAANVSVGRGAGIVIMAAGALMAISAFATRYIKSIRALEAV